MMKGLSLLLLAAVVYAIPQGKSYNPTENELRFINFVKALQFVEEHNTKFAAGEVTFDVEMNAFADWTPEEFARRNGYVRRNATEVTYEKFDIDPKDLPESVDWREKNYVTDVKDQGQCGSCWAFGTTGVLEGQLFKNTGKLIPLSESELVDCDRLLNGGCNGGLQTRAYLYIQKNGLTTEDQYPYQPRRSSCNKGTKPVVYLDGHKSTTPQKEEELTSALATVGPITIAIDASHMSFQLYKSGVYYEPKCSKTRLDHAVLAVGYGASGSDKYFIVKNSWSTSWGINGYINMARGRDNNCGVATECSWPTGVRAA